MNLQVGQIIFVVPRETTKLLPMQVVEEIKKKTLKGEETTYSIKHGRNDDTRMYDVSKINGEIFVSAEAARTELIKRAKTAIEKMVNGAVDVASKWYQNGFEAMNNELMPSDDIIPQINQKDDTNIVMLEDGTKARVIMPDLNNVKQA